MAFNKSLLLVTLSFVLPALVTLKPTLSTISTSSLAPALTCTLVAPTPVGLTCEELGTFVSVPGINFAMEFVLPNGAISVATFDDCANTCFHTFGCNSFAFKTADLPPLVNCMLLSGSLAKEMF